jgi:putative endonuclease
MFFVYILSSLTGTLYVGLTDDLRRRVEEHKLGLVDSFTKKYNVKPLDVLRGFSRFENRRES